MRKIKISLKKGLPVFVLLTGLFLSCSNDIPHDLVIRVSELALTEESDDYFQEIYLGNGDYIINTNDENIVKATYTPDGAREYIRLSPQKAGKTEVTVTDKRNGQQSEIRIHVVPAYLDLRSCGYMIFVTNPNPEEKIKIETEISKSMSLKHLTEYILIRDKTQSLYAFRTGDYTETSMFLNGTYRLEEQQEGFCLFFHTSMQPYRFLANNEAASLFRHFFKSGDYPTPEFGDSTPLLQLTEDRTEEFKKEYPDTEKAEILYTISWNTPNTTQLPDYLFVTE